MVPRQWIVDVQGGNYKRPKHDGTNIRPLRSKCFASTGIVLGVRASNNKLVPSGTARRSGKHHRLQLPMEDNNPSCRSSKPPLLGVLIEQVGFFHFVVVWRASVCFPDVDIIPTLQYQPGGPSEAEKGSLNRFVLHRSTLGI